MLLMGPSTFAAYRPAQRLWRPRRGARRPRSRRTPCGGATKPVDGVMDDRFSYSVSGAGGTRSCRCTEPALCDSGRILPDRRLFHFTILNLGFRLCGVARAIRNRSCDHGIGFARAPLAGSKRSESCGLYVGGRRPRRWFRSARFGSRLPLDRASGGTEGPR